MSDAIAPAGKWRVTLVEVGRGIHPGVWVGPDHADWYWSPFNVVVLRSSDQTLLIDAGPGITGSWWPFDGFRADTETALANIGVAPADVDLVILTHLDYDHAGGLLAGSWPDDLRLVYCRAPVVVHEEAIQYAKAADPDAPDNVGTRLIALLESQGRLVSVSDGTEVADSVFVRSAPGHRAGHVCVEVDGPDPFVHAADTFHNQEHVAHPEWDNSSDSDTELALETRRRVLAELADAGARTVITHMPGPHAFRVVALGGVLSAVPDKA